MKQFKTQINSKKIIINSLFLLIFITFSQTNLYSQCQPYIKIDGNRVLANQTVAAGLALPFWLAETQTLAIDQMVNSISVIEFNVVGSTLEFSQVLSINSTSPQVVPGGKVWKIESISKQPTLSEVNGAAYSNVGTYTFTVPLCASYICVEAWGGGGGGGAGNTSYAYGGGGGGGGGYGQGCFTVSPGSNYTVTVGDGGNGGNGGSAGAVGGTTSVGALITATGGNGGAAGTTSAGGIGGTGGTSTASVYVAGGVGGNGALGGSNRNGGIGGNSGSGPDLNGGIGGAGGLNGFVGNTGSTPGAGGGGGAYDYAGGKGAPGRVIIRW
jgi:hypothetical protein